MTEIPAPPFKEQLRGEAYARLFREVGLQQVEIDAEGNANVPISLGLPAFAMASQSAPRGGRAHSLDEWTEVEKPAAVKDFALALALILSVAETP